MKYSKTTLMELSHKYSSILRKCALLNAAILMGAMVALPAGAETITTRQERNTSGSFTDVVTANGVETTGSQYGAILFNNTGVITTFEKDVTLTNNTNDWAAGAVSNGGTSSSVNGGTILFNGTTTLSHNTSANAAGALYNLNGNITFLENSTFEGNKAAENGGAIVNKGENATIIFKKNANFSENTASLYGGALENGGNITFEGTSTFSGNKSTLGGAIHNSGTIVYNDLATFNDNYTSGGENGGVIYNSGNITFNNGLKSYSNGRSPDKTKISGTNISNISGNLKVLGGNVEIMDNFAKQGAGLVNVETGTTTLGSAETALSKVLFDNNETTSTGGAIYNGKTMTIYADNAELTNNRTTAGYAGAVGNMAGNFYLYGKNNKFESNKSLGSVAVDDAAEYKYGGGAIQNNSGTVVIGLEDGSSTNKFIGNESAMHGGAVLSRGGTTTFNGCTYFENNNAAVNGGAIHNIKSSVMTFNGNTAFTNNTANDVANDIYNDGTINFNGDVTLDGGIAGAGIVNFAENTSLTAELQKTTILANTVAFGGNNIINLKVANGLADDEYDFIDADTLTKNGVTIADNAVYNLTLTDEGKVNVSVKSGSEIAESIDVPVTAQEANTLGAVIASNGNGTGIGNAIADAMSDALQSGNAAAAVQAAKELAPTTSQQVMGIAQGVNNLLSNVTGTRMAALGKSGGDAFIGGSTWIQGLYNHTKQDASGANAGFSANTKGIAFGIDGKANDALTIGIGYGYTVADADSAGRNVDVDGHNIFVYGQYQPEQFYVNTMLSYGLSKYTEKKSPMGVAMKAKYDVNTFAANLMTGYDFSTGITPEGGLRYISADQESYNDGAQNISTDRNDVLTAVMGVKYTANVKAEDWTFKPTLRLAATYDVKSDNSKANVNIIGGGNYQITGDRLHRFGVETGVGVTSSVKDWDLTLEYNGGYRKDFQSHTGMLKATYHF